MNFREYLSHLFERPAEEIRAATAVRNFARWFFALLCNFVLIGLLKYFYHETGSDILKAVAHRLNLAVNLLITGLLFFLVNKATSIVVIEPSRAYAA